MRSNYLSSTLVMVCLFYSIIKKGQNELLFKAPEVYLNKNVRGLMKAKQ